MSGASERKQWAGLPVRKHPCDTCIFRRDSALADHLPRLLDEVRDPHMGFRGARICHHEGGSVACRGFWERHKDEYPAGQVAQRIDMVIEVLDGSAV